MSYSRKVLIYSVLLISFPLCTTVFAEKTVLSLNEAINIAVEHSPELDIARQQLAASHGVLQQSRAQYLPHLSAGGNLGRINIDNGQPVDEDNVTTLLFNLSQLIYDFGSTTGLINASAFARDAAQANVEQSLHNLVFNVKQSYYSVLEKQDLINVAVQGVNTYDAQLYRAEKYLKAGIRTRIDVTNAQVNLSNERLNLLQAQADFKRARVKLEQTLGTIPYNGSYTLVPPAASPEQMIGHKPGMPGPLQSLLTAAEKRPGLVQYTHLMEAAEATLTQARGSYFPAIAVNGNYTDYETDITGLYDQWQVGVGLNWEFFSGFESRGKVAEARAHLREITASRKRYELAVIQEVTDSYHSADETGESVNIAGETLTLAAENLELADKRYQNGLGDLLEFSDAQLLFSQNRTRLISAYYGYLTALARLDRAIGVSSDINFSELNYNP